MTTHKSISLRRAIVVAALPALLALAAPAAARGDGATVINDSGCVAVNPFVTTCYDIKSTTKTTTTSSGNLSYATNGKSHADYKFTSGTCTYSRDSEIHQHVLLKGDDRHGETLRLSETTQFVCGSLSQTCTMTFYFHYANGEVQYGRPEFVCTSD